MTVIEVRPDYSFTVRGPNNKTVEVNLINGKYFPENHSLVDYTSVNFQQS